MKDKLQLKVVSIENDTWENHGPLQSWIPEQSSIIKSVIETQKIKHDDEKESIVYAEIWVQEEGKEHLTLILHDGVGEPGLYNPNN